MLINSKIYINLHIKYTNNEILPTKNRKYVKAVSFPDCNTFRLATGCPGSGAKPQHGPRMALAPLVHGLCTDGAMALHKTEKSLAIFFLQRDDTAIWHNGEREKAPVFSRNFLPFDVTSSNDRHFIYLSLLQPGFQQGRNLGSFPCHGNADSLKSSHFLFRRARTA